MAVVSSKRFQAKWAPVRVKKTRRIFSKALAGVGVADCHREKAETESQHDDVPHQVLLLRGEMRISVEIPPP
jgi:hypothetical protein